MKYCENSTMCSLCMQHYAVCFIRVNKVYLRQTLVYSQHKVMLLYNVCYIILDCHLSTVKKKHTHSHSLIQIN